MFDYKSLGSVFRHISQGMVKSCYRDEHFMCTHLNTKLDLRKFGGLIAIYDVVTPSFMSDIDAIHVKCLYVLGKLINFELIFFWIFPVQYTNFGPLGVLIII